MQTSARHSLALRFVLGEGETSNPSVRCASSSPYQGSQRNGGAYASLAQGSQRDGVGTPPLCKGRCHSEAVTEGLPPLQNNTPSGETTPFAPKRPFGTFRCFAWLIRIKEHTVLFYSKRSCFRFAALTLRVSSHRNDSSGHSGSKGTGEPKARHSPRRIVMLTGLWSE